MMKQTITYSFILILALTCSCTNKSDQLLESKYKDFISLEKKGMAIHIDENTLSSYQLFSSLKVFNNKFETIYESKLDSKTYSYYNGWGIWNNRLFITKDNILDENKDFDSFEMDLFNPMHLKTAEKDRK